MRHIYLKLYPENSSAHWATGITGKTKRILLQIDDGIEQARITITEEEAVDIASSLLDQVHKIFASYGK